VGALPLLLDPSRRRLFEAARVDLRSTFMRRAAAGIATNADAEKVLHDPLSGYDRITLCKEGVKAWTCVDKDGKPLPVTPEAINDLDEDALEWMATQVLKLTKPSLFQTDDEKAADRKNG